MAASRWSRSPSLTFLVVILLGIAAPFQMALSASANVSPSAGAGGRLVTLSASGFDQDGVGYNTGFYAVVGNGLIGVCPPESRANCSIQVNLPASFPGAFEIEARNSAGETGRTTYTVAPAQFSISPACGPAGTTVTAHGKFFAVNSDAGLQFDGSYVATNNYPDANGTFSRSFVVPAAADGDHPVLAQNSAGNSQFQEFRIPCAPVGFVPEVTGPVFRCLANCGAPNPADRTLEPVHPGDPVRQGEQFETGDSGRLTFQFQDNTALTLSKNTKFKVEDYVFDSNTPTLNTERYTIFAGSFTYLSGLMGKQNNRDHIVETAYGAIGIRGTWFVTRLNEATGHQEMYLSNGEIAVTPDGPGLPSIFNGPVTVVFDANGVSSSPFVDGDADGVADPADNCALLANTSQCDSDGDGYGNRCDADLNNNGATNAQDTVLFRAQLGQPSAGPGFNKADLNCSGAVNAQDTVLFRARLGSPPGPSGPQP